MEKDFLQGVTLKVMVIPAVWRQQKACLHEHLLASLVAAWPFPYLGVATLIGLCPYSSDVHSSTSGSVAGTTAAPLYFLWVAISLLLVGEGTEPCLGNPLPPTDEVEMMWKESSICLQHPSYHWGLWQGGLPWEWRVILSFSSLMSLNYSLNFGSVPYKTEDLFFFLFKI